MRNQEVADNGYNLDVTRRLVYYLCFAVLFVACNRAPGNKEAIRAGVLEHLQKGAALDLAQLDVDVTDVKFEGNKATAQVSFKPKASPQNGMNMSYTLERKGSKWEVIGRGTGHGGAMGGMMGGGAPAGEMPPGHPPTESPAEGGSKPGGTELPPGHPPVNAPPPKK
jgi:hypothetical protein